jgi:hypothetical protein
LFDPEFDEFRGLEFDVVPVVVKRVPISRSVEREISMASETVLDEPGAHFE